ALSYQTASEEDDIRGLKPRQYAKNLRQRITRKRPKSKNTTQGVQDIAAYIPLDNDNKTILGGIDVGIIFWRLREAREADDQVVIEKQRIAKRVKARVVETEVRLIPERADSETEFLDGDLMRLSVELPLEGYIYILNREQYADGSFSDPYLIFPGISDI